MTWERLVEALESIKEKEMANKVRDKYPQQEEMDTADGDDDVVRTSLN